MKQRVVGGVLSMAVWREWLLRLLVRGSGVAMRMYLLSFSASFDLPFT